MDIFRRGMKTFDDDKSEETHFKGENTGANAMAMI